MANRKPPKAKNPPVRLTGGQKAKGNPTKGGKIFGRKPSLRTVRSA